MKNLFHDWLGKISDAENKRSEGLLNRMSEEFEDDLLNHESFPVEHFNLFSTLLSDPKYYNKPGVWNFVMAVSNARDALSESQYENIKNVFLNNFKQYLNKDLCLAVCDFVARNMDHVAADSILNRLKADERNKPAELQGYADEGLFILSQEIRRSNDGPSDIH